MSRGLLAPRWTSEQTMLAEASQRFIADTWIHTYGALPAPEGERAVQALRRLDRVELTMDPLQPGRRVFDPEIYDHPVFIHPPVYPVLLAASRLMLGSWGGPLLSIRVHVATVVAVALLGRLWFGEKTGLLAAVLVALDPIT